MKKALSVFLATMIAITALCSCGKKDESAKDESFAESSSTTSSSETSVSDVEVDIEDDKTENQTTATQRVLPDYSLELIENLGVEPAPSYFSELKSMAQSRKDERMRYDEDEEHHYCTFVFRGNLCYLIRYEKAKEWFDYFFSQLDYLYFEKDEEGRLFMRDEYYGGPEGMLMTYMYRVFVDDSCKYLVLVDGANISDADIEAFKNVSLVTVERFRDYYSLNESEIDDVLIEDYIFLNNIDEYELAREDHGEELRRIISEGSYYKLGCSIPYIIENAELELTPEEFVKEAKFVYFEFEFPVPESDETMTENMVFDLKRNKVYFNADSHYYRDAEMCEDLNPEALEFIYEELPKNVGLNDGNKHHDLEYSYLVYIIDAQGKYMRFTVLAKNYVNASFDVYWRTLYKMCFGKDHELDVEGLTPEQNVKRRLNHSDEPTLRIT